MCWLKHADEFVEASGPGGHSQLREFPREERQEARDELRLADGAFLHLFPYESPPDQVDGLDEPLRFDV